MTYYEIEEWVPPERAISGEGYWVALQGRLQSGTERWRTESWEDALECGRALSRKGRNVRVVQYRVSVMWGGPSS